MFNLGNDDVSPKTTVCSTIPEEAEAQRFRSAPREDQFAPGCPICDQLEDALTGTFNGFADRFGFGVKSRSRREQITQGGRNPLYDLRMRRRRDMMIKINSAHRVTLGRCSPERNPFHRPGEVFK